MKRKTKILSILLFSFIFAFVGNESFADKLELDMKLIVRGQYIELEDKFILEDGETYMPIRPIADALNIQVEYTAEDYSITLKNGQVSMKNPIGSDSLKVGDKDIKLLGKTFMHNKKTYFPVQSLGNILGESVVFDVKNQVIVFGNFERSERLENTYSFENEKDGYIINVPSKYKDSLFIREDGLYIRSGDKDIIKISKSDKPSLNEDNIVLNYENGNYIEGSLLDDNTGREEFLNIMGSFKKLEGHNFFYENEKLGFRIYIPLTWEGRYRVQESEDGVAFFHKSIDTDKPEGFLFGIERRIGDLITEEDIKESPMPVKLLMQADGYTFVETRPSGVEYDPSDEKDTLSYETMRNDIETVTSSIKPFNLKGIKAKNPNYKLLGSSFFTVEIPKDMRLVKSRSNNFLWNLKIGEEKIGGIELITFSNNCRSEVYDCKYLENAEETRKIKFFVDKGAISKEDFDRIFDSIKIQIYNSNNIDNITTLEEYLKKGGREVTGLVEKYGTDGKNITSITINGKRYEADYPRVVPVVDGQYPMYEYSIFDEDYIKTIGGIGKRAYRVILNEKDQVMGLIELKKSWGPSL